MRMKRVRGWMVVGGALIMAGCGSSASKSEVSLSKNAPKIQSGSAQQAGTTTLVEMTSGAVKEKPGVTRVVLTLDGDASFSTSREGNQLIVNVFNAKLNSSVQPVSVNDTVVKTLTAKEAGNSVKGMIELVSSEVAYTPSKGTNPNRIFIDVWRLSSQLGMKKGETVAVITPSETKTSDDTAAMPSQDVSVDVKPAVIEPTTTSGNVAVTPPSQDMPAQLEWFSQKLSEVLQEREKIKQDLLMIEQKVAVKDSMIQVLERKIKEANQRIVELEEEVIRANSKASLVEQNEQTVRNDLQQVLDSLEGASRGSSVAISATSDDPVQRRSAEIVSKISALQQENVSLAGAKEQVDSLRQQLDTLIQERDELRAQNGTYLAEIESLKGQVAGSAATQQMLQAKEYELAKLRKAIGEAAQLVSPSSAQIVLPQAHNATPTTEISYQAQEQEPLEMADGTSEVMSEQPSSDDSQLKLAELLQQNPPANADEYVLGAGDVIKITVANEENLGATVTVSSDGFITYGFLGDFRVDGLTVGQLDAQITSILGQDYLVNPDVTLEVIKPRSKKVYIMGMVKQPGYHELQGDQRLLGTLLSAGGPSAFTTEAKILRLPTKQDMVSGAGADSVSPVIVDLNKLFNEGDQSQNLLLQDGDVIMIAEKGSAVTADGKPVLGPMQFYVVGSVAKPGIYNYQDNDTALDAILRAGGFTEFASRNETKVVRDENGKTKTFKIKMKDVMEKGEMDKNIPIMPGDMIIVPESFF